MPVTYYAVYRVTAIDPGWSAFWSSLTALPYWPSGPMWFLSLPADVQHHRCRIFTGCVPRAGEWLAGLSAKADTRPVRYGLVLAGVAALAYVPLSGGLQALAVGGIRA